MIPKPVYSICMCNYNMATTLERSLQSLLAQLDDRFEIVVIDDGSRDDSVRILESIQHRYPALRFVVLPRDKRRKLGMTRNISIREARGDYVLLHLDCDDVFGPHIPDFVEVFHRIEQCLKRDILLSGQHINMARREFLLGHGPYRNIYRGEDRELWCRMAAINAYIPIDHVDFIRRLPRRGPSRTIKAAVNTFDHIMNDFRTGMSIREFIHYERQRRAHTPWRLRLFRTLLMIPAWAAAKRGERVPLAITHETFAAYRERTRGSYPEIMSRHGCSPDLTFLAGAEARRIFSVTGSTA